MSTLSSSHISSYPMPPAYYNQYNDENMKRGRVPKPPQISSPHDSYQVFGATCQADDVILRPVESQEGIQRLYPQNFDHRQELKKLNHSILVNYLDLLEVLIICPETQGSGNRQDKIKDLNQHLINEFRPHQARETLRVLMELQKRNSLEICDRFQKNLEKCLDIIKQASANLPDHYDLEMNHICAMAEALSRNPKEKLPEPVILVISSCKDEMMCDIVDNNI